MSLGDEFLVIGMGCGCFFLVAGRRAWYWRVRLSGLPSYSEANRAAAGFQVVSSPSLCNDRCQGGAELKSLFMRQSTVALGRIPAFLARAVHTWRYGAYFLLASYLAVTRPVSRRCL